MTGIKVYQYTLYKFPLSKCSIVQHKVKIHETYIVQMMDKI